MNRKSCLLRVFGGHSFGLSVLFFSGLCLGQTNVLPPNISIGEPTNGEVFVAPTNIQLSAAAGYLGAGGAPTNLEFFANGGDLGRGIITLSSGFSGVYSMTWTNPAPGNYSLTAVGMYNTGQSVTSTPVNIMVVQSKPTNLPPIVRIAGPANGAVFRAPINIPISIYAYDEETPITALTVQVFADTNSLGFASLLPLPASICTNCPPPPDFGLVWSNAPPGDYALTAVAADTNGGATTVSAPIQISVLPALLPPTNQPAIVSVIASDPIAVAITNSWVWPGETNTPPRWSAWPVAVPLWHTNIGPKTAAFTISRFGLTNMDLAVAYSLGGTASNGVDYVALPGMLTIPAGQRQSLITVVPIDNGSPAPDESVFLTLLPSTNAPPNYVLGFPRRAGVLIIDSNQPKAAITMLPGACIYYSAPGPDGAWYYMENSSDLVHWTAISTNQVINGSIDFIDPATPGNPARFYRAVPLNNLRAE